MCVKLVTGTIVSSEIFCVYPRIGYMSFFESVNIRKLTVKKIIIKSSYDFSYQE